MPRARISYSEEGDEVDDVLSVLSTRSERRSLADALDAGRYDPLKFPELLFQRIRRDALNLDRVVVLLLRDFCRRGGEGFPGRGIYNEALVLVVCEPS